MEEKGSRSPAKNDACSDLRMVDDADLEGRLIRCDLPRQQYRYITFVAFCPSCERTPTDDMDETYDVIVLGTGLTGQSSARNPVSAVSTSALPSTLSPLWAHDGRLKGPASLDASTRLHEAL